MISLLLTLVVIGLILWLVETYIPMDPAIKAVLRVLVVICLIVWLLQAFGFGVLNAPVPQYHGVLR